MNQPVAIDPQSTIPGVSRAPGQGQPPGLRDRLRATARHPVTVHLAVLLAYVAAGIAVTWPRATYLADGRVPATLDASGYVWDLWWMAHCVEHLSQPVDDQLPGRAGRHPARAAHADAAAGRAAHAGHGHLRAQPRPTTC